ncbi:MAG: serine/threonine-protein kinase [Sumerlaeia bacterium]
MDPNISDPTPRAIPRAVVPDRTRAAFAKRNYEIQGELGRGGMGVVYLATHRKLGRKVAIKTLSPERATRENSRQRFEREARTFAQIRHPNIATLFEFEDEGPLQYLALEYIDGYDLESERRRGKKWDLSEAARVIATVAEALDYTHKQGILHRDIKPGNILIERSTNRVVLTDFGLAKGSKDDTLTATGFAVGTPAYMAPEQISDQFGVKPDGRSDVFSLGTVFYEMITGKHPFIGADDLKTMRGIVHNDPVALRDIDPSIPDPVERIIFAMLRKHPQDRLESAGQTAKLLREWLERGAISERLPAMGAGAQDEAPAPAKAATPAPAAAQAPATPAQTAAPRNSTTSNSQPAFRLTPPLIVALVLLAGTFFICIGILIGILMRGLS